MNKKGFTLVELVVVIAIIGVLAAILVPSMMGYVKKARLKQVNGNAKVAYNVVVAVQGDCVTAGETFNIVDTEIDCRNDNPNPGDEQITTVYNYIRNNAGNSGIVYVGRMPSATDNDEVFVHWMMAPGDTVVGQYPEASNDLTHLPTYMTFTHR